MGGLVEPRRAAYASLGATAKIMPCSHGSSGGLALVTAPGSDDRSILVQEDCLNVESDFCIDGLVLMSMLPKEDRAGINVLRIEFNDNSLEITQVDIDVWYISDGAGSITWGCLLCKINEGLVLSSVANLVHLRGEDVGSNPAWTILVAE